MQLPIRANCYSLQFTGMVSNVGTILDLNHRHFLVCRNSLGYQWERSSVNRTILQRILSYLEILHYLQSVIIFSSKYTVSQNHLFILSYEWKSLVQIGNFLILTFSGCFYYSFFNCPIIYFYWNLSRQYKFLPSWMPAKGQRVIRILN